MDTVQRLEGHRALKIALAAVVIAAAMVVAGLVGYLVKGTATAPVGTTAAPPSAVQSQSQPVSHALPDTLDRAGAAQGSHSSPDTQDRGGG